MPFPEPASGSSAPAVPQPLPGAPPFGVGSVVGRAFKAFFGNFVPFSIVTLALYAPVLVLAARAPVPAAPGWVFADQVLSFLAVLVVMGALTYGVLQSLDGRRVGMGALVRKGFRKMGWVFVVSLGVGLWMILGVILLVIPAIVWYCALYTAIPAVVVEDDLGGFGALRRSRELTKGHRWAILGVVAVMAIVSVLATAIAGGLVGVAGAVLPSAVAAVLVKVVLALANALGSCASAVAYHDLRVAKEGIATADLVKVFE